MNYSEQYMDFLWMLFTHPLTSKAAYIATVAHPRTAYSHISRALIEKHIRTGKQVNKSGKWKHATEYVFLTRKGLTYLLTHLNDPVYESIPLGHIDQATPTGPVSMTMAGKNKTISVCESDILCKAAGADGPLLPNRKTVIGMHEEKDYADYDEEDEELNRAAVANSAAETNAVSEVKYSWTDLIQIAAQTADESILNLECFHIDPKTLPLDYIRYTSIRDIRRLVVSHAEELDFRRVRFDGIIENTKKALPVYNCIKPGLAWTAWHESNELILKDKWCMEYALSPNAYTSPDNSAVLFVSNAKHLSNILHNTAKARGRSTSLLGNSFTNFYAIPKSSNGVMLLNWIMTGEPEEYAENIYRLVKEQPVECEAGILAKGNVDTPYSDIFPLTFNDIPLAVCVTLDIKQIESMLMLKKIYGLEKIAVLCYTWQKPYYAIIFPEDEIRTISEFMEE